MSISSPCALIIQLRPSWQFQGLSISLDIRINASCIYFIPKQIAFTLKNKEVDSMEGMALPSFIYLNPENIIWGHFVVMGNSLDIAPVGFCFCFCFLEEIYGSNHVASDIPKSLLVHPFCLLTYIVRKTIPSCCCIGMIILKCQFYANVRHINTFRILCLEFKPILSFQTPCDTHKYWFLQNY